MINTSNLEEAKKLIKKEQSLKVIIGQEDNFNRKILENGKFDILMSIEEGNRKNKIRQTDSGLNHILAIIARKNDIAIGINLQEIANLNSKEKAERLSKIIQNLKICRKAKTRIGLKASTNQIKEAIVF